MRVQRVLTKDEAVVPVIAGSGPELELLRGNLADGFEPAGRNVSLQKLLPPVDPPAVFLVGLTYRDHAKEMGMGLPEFPVVAMKPTTSVIAAGETIRLPRFLRSDSVDFEAELAVVIGRTCRNLAPSEATNYIAGYTIANDVSARDWQKIHGGGQWTKGKGFDTFCPLGPCLVTPDELADPGGLTIRSRLNGEVFQESSTRELIFPVSELVAFLSGSTTLLPGTVILTGTPPGVGMARTPPRHLRPGDMVEIEIEGIGTLTNPVAEESVA